MNAIKQQIMTIDAKSLFKYFPIKADDENQQFIFDARKKSLFSLVVKEVHELDDCPMLNQLLHVTKDERGDLNLDDNELIFNHFLIMDFGDVFMPVGESASEATTKWKDKLLLNARSLLENGLKIQFEDEIVELIPFDKSGNMSRNSRISFIDSKYLDRLDERLNLGIDFSNIPVILSKYYAYRGLYLSSSNRIEHKQLELSEKTIIVIKDNRKKAGKDSLVNGHGFSRDVPIMSAKQGEELGDWNFIKPQNEDVKTIDTPFDGVGIIVPSYVSYINEVLRTKGANSFQIRLPFAKGMIHEVDVLAFIEEFSVRCQGEEKYKYVDAFNIERDLREAKIFLTESMLKCKGWLEKYCEEHNIEDPMQYYCEMLRKYDHSLYISGTNLPYGQSKYTHLSYQILNTLALEEDEFKQLIEHHGEFIKNPIDFVTEWNESEQSEVDSDKDFEEAKVVHSVQNWKLAVASNKSLSGDLYIKSQLENVQKSLLSKLALGKILVEGQTRYLCRDLLPLLATLLRNEDDIEALYFVSPLNRFYFPNKGNEKNVSLEYEKYYAFFRNPHLSRNEQYIMRPFIMPQKGDTFAADGKKVLREQYEELIKQGKMALKYEDCVEIYDKYFGKLTGIIMVPRGSTLPLCLGGADFDGDLIKLIVNQNVVNAVKRGCYEEQYSPSLNWFKPSLAAIEIPSTSGNKVIMPFCDKDVLKYVTYEQVKNTFSNYIGKISNAAIAIGQEEYGRGIVTTKEFDENEPTCSKCTLLTGLEIDAAKNGVHPKLDVIFNGEKRVVPYLDFIKKYRLLKSETNFHLENVVLYDEEKVVDGNEKKYVLITAKGCDTEIEWFTESEDQGTYINLLPHYFIKYYKEWKDSKLLIEKFKLGKSKLSKTEKDTINEFKKACDDILCLYKFYNNHLLKLLTNEKNKGFYAVDNIEIQIMRAYDESQVDEVLFQLLPAIKDKIRLAIVDKKSIDDIRRRINDLQWQFQPKNLRGVVLEEIIGNGFKESDLTDEEKDVLYNFNQQGYKLLWRIIDTIAGPNRKTYAELIEKAKKESEMDISETLPLLNEKLNDIANDFYNANKANASATIYVYCLENLRNVIGIYAATFDDTGKLVTALYQKTKSTASYAKFFWDAFTWNQIKEVFVEKEVHVPNAK